MNNLNCCKCRYGISISMEKNYESRVMNGSRKMEKYFNGTEEILPKRMSG